MRSVFLLRSRVIRTLRICSISLKVLDVKYRGERFLEPVDIPIMRAANTGPV